MNSFKFISTHDWIQTLKLYGDARRKFNLVQAKV